MDATENQLSSISEITVTFLSPQKTTLGNTEFFKYIGRITIGNTTAQQVYYIKKVDGYMCYVIATLNEYTVAEIEAMFKSS
jgi:hypothetical protein